VKSIKLIAPNRILNVAGSFERDIIRPFDIASRHQDHLQREFRLGITLQLGTSWCPAFSSPIGEYGVQRHCRYQRNIDRDHHRIDGMIVALQIYEADAT
jgi:hypothetical protein